MLQAYSQLKTELSVELNNILKYWTESTLDNEYGGFLGKRNHYNEVVSKASKGIILNSRILWSFSGSSNHLKTDDYKSICERSFQYLKNHFKDNTHKGVYWVS